MNIGSPKNSPSLLRKLKSLTSGGRKKSGVVTGVNTQSPGSKVGSEGRKFSLGAKKLSVKRPPSVDRESLGSHGSGEGSGGSSGASTEDKRSKSPAEWTNPLGMRFIPSYVPHAPPPPPPASEPEPHPLAIPWRRLRTMKCPRCQGP